jgi:hypothetical protein
MKKKILWIGIISFLLFFVLEIATDIWFGAKFPGYNWKTQSISYLGQSGSPLEKWVLVWGVVFTLLITLFAYTFYQTHRSNKWVVIATGFLLIYGLGEGLGSGCFPINPPGTSVTLDGKLHNIFSGIGDTGLIFFPFALMLMFPKKENQKLHLYLWSVTGIGLVMVSFFMFAKYLHQDNFMLHFKGVWQRIYLLNYYLMLLVVSTRMVHQIRLEYSNYEKRRI